MITTVETMNERAKLIGEAIIKRLNGKITDEQLNPSLIIKDIEQIIRKTYHASDETIKTLSLWIYGTYFYQQFKEGFPYLMIYGEKGSGKTTLTSIIELLSFNSTEAYSISNNALLEAISSGEYGTFIIDEDSFSLYEGLNNTSLRKILKDGYSNAGEFYKKENVEPYQTKRYSTFCPKVIILNGKADSVLENKSILIDSKRVTSDVLSGLEDVYEYKNGSKANDVNSLTSRAMLSAVIHSEKLGNILETIPESTDRDTRNQRPLIAMHKLTDGSFTNFNFKI